ncbi:MAG TPA: acyltransferase [Puia sp.]|nr:acyltransferase [Puia sp.]
MFNPGPPIKLRLQQPKQLYLEFIRGTVAILVFLAHTIELLPPITDNPTHFMIEYVGTDSVMIFFLLSGCVINISQTRKPKTQQQFFVNRALRLFPQFIVGVLTALIVILILKMPTPSPGRIIGNFFMISTIQGYIVTSFRTNLPLWTLTFEMTFYLIFLLCIGKGTSKKVWLWFLIAMVTIPLYYSDIITDFERHFVFILSFSTIWIVGYFIYAYRRYFYASTYASILSFGMLPIISRLHLFNLPYDPLNYLLFALMAAPFFRLCLQEKPQGFKIGIGYILAAYVFFGILLFLKHDASKFSSKIAYTILPTALVFGYYIIGRLNLKEKFLDFVQRSGAITGKYSYSLYIIHYPILYFLGSVIQNKILYIVAGIIVVAIASYLLESVYQPVIVRLFRKKSLPVPVAG